MLVAAHKAAQMPGDGFYLPVHVGSALTDRVIDAAPDSEGPNISHLNDSFCELTATYWAWQNHPVDAIGLSHYRRYFKGHGQSFNNRLIMSRSEAINLLSNHRLILARPRNYVIDTVYSHYAHSHVINDLDLAREIILDNNPHYAGSVTSVLNSRRFSQFNMFLMTWEDFNEYCTWLFDTLLSVHQSIDLSNRSPYQQRAIGYLGERLLNIWVHHNVADRHVGYVPILNVDGEPKLRKARALIKRKIRRTATGDRNSR